MPFQATIHCKSASSTSLWTVHQLRLPSEEASSHDRIQADAFKIALLRFLLDQGQTLLIDAEFFQNEDPDEYFGLPLQSQRHLPFGYQQGLLYKEGHSFALRADWPQIEDGDLLEAMNAGALIAFAGLSEDLREAARYLPEVSQPHDENFWLHFLDTASSLTQLTFWGYGGHSLFCYTRPQFQPPPWERWLGN